MKRVYTTGLLSLALLSGCGDGTGPARVALLSVSEGSIPVEEVTLTPGATLQLKATPMSEARKALEDRPVRWTSTAARVATVHDSTGLVTAVSAGTALVIATSEGISDTVRVNVAERVAGAVACPAGSAPLALEVGQVRTVPAFDAVVLCLAGGNEGAEFTLIPFNSFSAAISRMRVELSAAGTTLPFGPPSPYLGGAAETPPAVPALVPDAEFHQRLNDQTQQRFAMALRAGAGAKPSFSLAPGGPSYARLPAVGDKMELNVRSNGTDGCADPVFRTGQVRAVSARAIVVADVGNPAGGFTDADYQGFARDFDRLVWTVGTRSFGEPSDIDGNDRTVIFFTRAVNELTGPGASSYVGGFFFNRDLFRREGDNPCKGSNEREMLYMLVPDPGGDINENPRSTEFVRSTTVSVLAHEFQHLVNDSRRLHVSRAPVWEERWLNEGLSHIAEELVFYEVTGLTPERNLSIGDVATTHRTPFTHFALENVERLVSYLERPEGESTLGDDNLATRGAAWAFLRYAADRKTDPAGQRQLWHSLVNSRTQGLDNLRRVLGVEPSEWLQDWTVALYTDDAVAGVEERFTQPSWNFRSLIPGLRAMGIGESRHTRYPLRTFALAPEAAFLHRCPGSSVGSSCRLNLSGGGAAYLRFAVPATRTAAIQTTVNQLPAPSRLRLAVVRTR